MAVISSPSQSGSVKSQNRYLNVVSAVFWKMKMQQQHQQDAAADQEAVASRFL